MRKVIQTAAFFAFCASLVCLQWDPPAELGTVREAWAGDCNPNGNCTGQETCENCPADCGVCPDPCGDGSCLIADGENCSTCPADCGICCGNSTCDVLDNECTTCPADCDACSECGDCCGNSVCDAAECTTCPGDCDACTDCGICGGACDDGICDTGECTSCPQDCDACADCGICCGDSTCGSGECSSCPGDCQACADCGDCSGSCGDGTCQAGECGSCPGCNGCPADCDDCTDCGNCGMCGDLPIHDTIPNPPPQQPPGTITTFEAGTIIIPMDGCYARPTFMADKDIEMVFNKTEAEMVCNGNNETDDGLISGYGLVFRLIRAGITIHWPVSTSKTSYRDPDVTITRAGGSPVFKMNYTSGATDDRYGSLAQINYVGAPFLIAAEDVADARAIMASLPQFSAVDLHISQVQFQAEIFRSITELPKLGVLDTSNPADDWDKNDFHFTIGSIDEAGMEPEGSWWHVFDSAELMADRLTTEEFNLVWIPPFDRKNGDPLSAWQQTIIDKLYAWVDDGNPILFQDGSVGAMEGFMEPKWFPPFSAEVPSAFDQHSNGGLLVNGLGGVWGNGKADEQAASDDYGDPASQWAGIVWTGIGGSKYDWRCRPDQGYRDGVRRMVYSYDPTGNCALNDWTFAAWRHKDADTTKGRIYYLGGFHWRKNTASGFRLLLNTILVHAPSGDEPGSEFTGELARAAPIVATVDGIESHNQGTFLSLYPPEPANIYDGSDYDATFEFPLIEGHMRSIDTAVMSDSAVAFEDLATIYDAANGIPNAILAGCGSDYSGSCRTVFTVLDDGSGMQNVIFETNSASQLRPYMGSSLTTDEMDTLMSRVLAGRLEGGVYVPKLGGVDRSTVAIIESSPLAGVQRPTMVYFGALDGMLHAVCADALGACPAKGAELWAFVPPSQLPRLRMNTQRVDGSAKVIDVYGDFDNNGDREWRTVLVFQTGSGDPEIHTEAPAVYAFDITDPANPTYLWDIITPVSRGSYELGVGLNVAMGSVQTNDGLKHYTFIQTNNGGTGGSGWVLTAVETGTGTVAWTKQFGHQSPYDSANPPPPADAIPGGVSAIDRSGGQSIDTILVPTISGDIWMLNADDGSNPLGSEPLFTFNEDFHPVGAPVAIYRDALTGKLHVLLASGGYAVPGATTWSPSNVEQFLISVALDIPVGEAPITRAKVATYGWEYSLGAGNRAYSQPIVAGGEVFVVTDSGDINAAAYGTDVDTGLLHRVGLSDGASKIASPIVLTSGSSSVDVSMGSETVFTGGGSSAQKTDLPDFDDNGSATELVFEAKKGRTLWLQLD